MVEADGASERNESDGRRGWTDRVGGRYRLGRDAGVLRRGCGWNVLDPRRAAASR